MHDIKFQSARYDWLGRMRMSWMNGCRKLNSIKITHIFLIHTVKCVPLFSLLLLLLHPNWITAYNRMARFPLSNPWFIIIYIRHLHFIMVVVWPSSRVLMVSSSMSGSDTSNHQKKKQMVIAYSSSLYTQYTFFVFRRFQFMCSTRFDKRPNICSISIRYLSPTVQLIGDSFNFFSTHAKKKQQY